MSLPPYTADADNALQPLDTVSGGYAAREIRAVKTKLTTTKGIADGAVSAAAAAQNTANTANSTANTANGKADDNADCIGVAGAVDLGTFTGSIIPDDSTVKTALQALETAVDVGGSPDATARARIDNLASIIGRAYSDTHMGTFTGSILPDDQTIKSLLQTLETVFETNYIRKATSVSGTANAITCVCSPVVPSLVDGTVVRFVPALANTSRTVTFAPDGLTAKPLRKVDGNTGIAIGDLQLGSVFVQYDGNMDCWLVLNPFKGWLEGTSTSAATAHNGNGKTYTFAHGQTAVPLYVAVRAYVSVGQTDLGYSAGNSVLLSNSDSGTNGITIEIDSTNIYLHVANTGINILNKSTYTNGTLSTAAKWELQVYSQCTSPL